ncbi:unnamed protein product [Meganyctiphanes norvegica]|uniref:Replication protein A subunit n=1 Tax=Meganyctiphanes norvegica TaxID=48144 RepID=A0AAV2QSW8_MEGNR
MANQLTRGAIAEIIEGGTPEAPVLQILSMKRIPSGTQERHRLLVSDGQWSSSFAMLATQLNGKVASGEISQNCIIQMNRFVCNTVQDNKKVLIILDLTVLQTGADVGQRIGDPQPFDITKKNAAPPAQPSKPAYQAPSVQRNTPNVAASPARSQSGQSIHPIASLTPYQNKWTIRARVTNKSDVRTWSNSKGEGKLFSVEFLDESGEIRATGFNQELDKFFDMLEVNKVYYVSSCSLKTANKQYSKLNNDYEMTFNKMTEIELCEEDDAVPTMQFSFLPIKEVGNADKDAIIDIIGVCKEFQDVTTITTKATGRELRKREIQIVDDSNTEVTMTLWGTTAETFDGSQQPIMAFKGVRVGDFNGKNLSMLNSSSLQINPDIKEAHHLKGWFDNGGNQVEMTSISNQRGAGGMGVGTNFKTFAEAKLENLGTKDAPDYYTVKASVVLLRKENCLYTACPSDNCNKKVIDMNNGLFRCEKCNREYDSFNWRLMLSGNLADATDNNWVTCFQDQAEALLGIKAQDLGSMREADPDNFNKVFNDATFKDFTMKLRVKMETYNDESRLKTTAVVIEPLDPVTYNKRLITEIKQMAQLS